MFARKAKEKSKLTGRSEGSNAGGRGQKGDKGFGELHLVCLEWLWKCRKVQIVITDVEIANVGRSVKYLWCSSGYRVLAVKRRSVVLPFLKDSADMDETASDERYGR